ncbi:trypsin-like serine peptidase [Pseudomonas brassicacearum]|uniref:trypsin-like serine peptidase n=1 Tax=Pseudomonas brassicacearum TaxID=930166 RepID=UPI003D6AABE0
MMNEKKNDLRKNEAHFFRGDVGAPGLDWMHPSNPLSSPYGQVCSIKVKNSVSTYSHRGSGMLLTPTLVLTAAHVVDLGQNRAHLDEFIVLDADGLYVVRGLNRGKKLGNSMILKIILFGSYNEPGQSGDMAIALLKTAQNNSNTLNPESMPENGKYVAQVAGYPYYDDVRANGNNIMVGRGEGLPFSFDDDGLYYQIDTWNGHSGAPVFVEQGEERALSWVGVHVADHFTTGKDVNKGLRFMQENLEWIKNVILRFGHGEQ